MVGDGTTGGVDLVVGGSTEPDCGAPALGLRITSMMGPATPPLVRAMIPAVDKSKLVLDAERIWLTMVTDGTFASTMSSTF